MRGVIVMLVLVGCGGDGSTGPAWPKSAGTIEPTADVKDGGESIEPRKPAVASIEASAGSAPAAVPAASADATTPAADAAKPDQPATPAGPTTPEDPILEEIVIDISD